MGRRLSNGRFRFPWFLEDGKWFMSKEAAAKPALAARFDSRPFPEKNSMICQGLSNFFTGIHDTSKISQTSSLGRRCLKQMGKGLCSSQSNTKHNENESKARLVLRWLAIFAPSNQIAQESWPLLVYAGNF